MNRREQLSPNWAKITNKNTGACYYINDITGEKVWYHEPKDKIRIDIETNGRIHNGIEKEKVVHARATPKKPISRDNIYSLPTSFTRSHSSIPPRRTRTNNTYMSTRYRSTNNYTHRSRYSYNDNYRYNRQVVDNSERDWHIKENEVQSGPFTEDEMRIKYNNGLLKGGAKVNNQVFESKGIWRSVDEYYPDGVYHPPFEGLMSAVVPVRKEFPWQYFDKESRYSTGGHWLCKRLLNGQAVMGRELNFEDEEALLVEAKSLRTIPHENIVQFYESFIFEKQLVVISEFMDGKTIDCLCSPTRQWSEAAISYVVREVLKGLQAIHFLNRVHGCLRSYEIQYNGKGEVKISDVGTAYNDNASAATTPYFMSPELIETGKVIKSDIWALGIVALHMAEGRIPRERRGEEPQRVLNRILTEDAPRLRNQRWSEDFRAFIQGTLQKQVDPRFSTEQSLAHAFIKTASLDSFVEVVSADPTPEVQQAEVVVVEARLRKPSCLMGLIKSLFCCGRKRRVVETSPTLHSVNPFWGKEDRDLSREELI